MHVRRLDLKEYIEVVELFIIGVGNVFHNQTVYEIQMSLKIVTCAGIRTNKGWMMR